MNDFNRLPTIDVLLPAYNEEASIGLVLAALPAALVRQVVVVNNASTDRTAAVATAAGAVVVHEPRRGYGQACLAGIAFLKKQPQPPEVLVFMDADFSDYPEELPLLIHPIIKEGRELVIGSRTLGRRQRGSLTPQQRVGNWLATRLLKLWYGVKFTDLGPFRAIRFQRLLEMDMQDTTYGWTVEMQLRAAQMGLSVAEVPVSYRRRIGTSKISGTLRGTVLAGSKILYTLFRYR